MEKKVLAIDNGTAYTKTSASVIFASTAKRADGSINKDDIQVVYKGNTYIVGDETISRISDADRTSEKSKELIGVCTLTAIGLSFPQERVIETDLVVGLPLAYYSQQKDSFKKTISSLPTQILINKVGFEQIIKIREIIVCPQGTTIIHKNFEKYGKDRSLVLDIGGLTIDVASFSKLNVDEKFSYNFGMFVLYERISRFLNERFLTNFKPTYMYELLQRGWITANGQKVNLDIIDDIIDDFVREAISNINFNVSIGSYDNVVLIGGGAIPLLPYLQKYIPYATLGENAQFANAEGYQFVGNLVLRER